MALNSLAIALAKALLKGIAWASKKMVRVFRGSPEERAYSVALAGAVPVAVAAHAPPDPERLSAILDRGAVGEMLITVVRTPLKDVDIGAFRAALAGQGYTVDDTRMDLRALIYRIRDEFLRRLPESDAGRAPQLSARMEQVYAGSARIEALLMGAVLSDGELPSALVGVREVYERARGHVRAGRFIEAGVVLDSVLDSLDGLADQVPLLHVRPLRQRVLLSKAQVAIKQGKSQRARELLAAARQLGDFTGPQRALAGWVLLNLGQAGEAREVLAEEFDGSEAWRRLRAVAALDAGAFDEFASLIGGEPAADHADVLAALVRYHANRGEFVRAYAALERLLSKQRTSPVDWSHPVSSSTSLLALYVHASDPEPFDSARLIAAVRALLDEVRPLEVGMSAVERKAVVWYRAQFHQILAEWDAARTAWAELAELAPDDAAHLLAASGGFTEDMDAVRRAISACASEADARVLEAQLALMSGDLRRAADILSAGAAAAPKDDRDRFLARALEARVEIGESVPVLLADAEAINDRIIRSMVRTSIQLRAGGAEGPRRALDEIQRGLADTPRDVVLLRMATSLGREVAGASVGGFPPDLRARARDIALSAAQALVDRLPSPEHRLLHVYALRAVGDLQAAYREVLAVEADQYVTRRSAGLVADLSRDLGRMREYAEAAVRFHREFGKSAETALAAGEANMIAEKFDEAKLLLEEAAQRGSEEIAVRAVIDLWRLAERRAEGGDATETEDAALDRMMREYERLRSPALASALLFRALGGPRETQVLELVVRDFGAITALPGWLAPSVVEVLEWQKSDQARLRNAERLWRAGLLPFESYANALGIPSAVAWVVLRRTGGYLATEPPPLAGSIQRALGLPPDPEDEPHNGAPSGYLVDETALFTLESIGALEAVLQADSLRGRLLVEADTYRRLQDTGIGGAPGDADRRAKARLLAAVASAARPLEPTMAVTLKVTDGSETLESDAHTADEDGIHSPVPVKSADVAGALLTLGKLDIDALAGARRAAPALFPATLSGLVHVDPDLPLVVGLGVLVSWANAGIVDALTRWPAGLVIQPKIRQHLLDQGLRAEFEETGLELVRTLARHVTGGIESGQLRLVSAAVELVESEESDAAGTEPQSRGAETPMQRDRLGRLLRSTERRLALAAESGTELWTDDLSAHAAADIAGPFVVGEPGLFTAVSRLRERYGGVRVSGTGAVLAALASTGAIEERTARRARKELVQARHWYVLDAAALAEAAAAADNDDAAADVLAYLHDAPQHLLPETAFRSVVSVVAAVAGAIGQITQGQLSESAKRRAVERVVSACLPWTDERLHFSHFASTTFWRVLSTQFGSSERVLAEMFSTLLRALENRWPESRALANTLPDLLDSALLLSIRHPGVLGQTHAAMSALVTAVTTATRPDGRQWLPAVPLRLAAAAVGLSSEIRIRATVRNNGKRGPSLSSHEIDSSEIRRAALQAIDIWLAEDPEGGPPDNLAESVFIERPALEAGAAPKVVAWEVDRTLLLLEATPAQRRVLAELVAREQEASGAPELARLTRKAAPYLALDDPEGRVALSDYYRALVQAPRTWMHEDPVRALRLLHDAPLEQLAFMVGGLPEWRTGETVLSYLERVAPGDVGEPAWRDTRHALLGGAASVALELAIAQLQHSLQEVVQDDTHPPDNFERQVATAGAFLAAALVRSDPYHRITALLGALMLTWSDAAVRETPLDIARLPVELGRHLAPAVGAQLGELVSAALAAALAPEPERERRDDEPSTTTDQAVPATYIERLGRLARAYDALHAETGRAALSAVLTLTHLEEASALWPDGLRSTGSTRPALDHAGDTPAAPDRLGMLLALTRALALQVFHGAVASAPRRDPHALRSALARRQTERDFAGGRSPSAELFLPEVLGPDPDRADPYRATLLRAIERMLNLAHEQSEPAWHGPPFWATPAVRAALERIVGEPPSAGEQELAARAVRPGAEDRFLSPCREPLATLARRVLKLLGTDIQSMRD